VFFIHAPCFLMCFLFYVSFIWLHVYAFVIHSMVHCWSASSQALPGLLITAPPPVLVPAVLGVLAVWVQTPQKKSYCSLGWLIVLRNWTRVSHWVSKKLFTNLSVRLKVSSCLSFNLLVTYTGQAVSCNSNWWWCVLGIFEAVERNRYFHWQFYVISDPCV